MTPDGGPQDKRRLRRLDGRYRLVEQLARGGTAAVWRGYDERLSRPVAIKILDNTQGNAVDGEATRLAMLAHPHVAAVYDYGRSRRRHFLVTELVEGSPLSVLLSAG